MSRRDRVSEIKIVRRYRLFPFVRRKCDRRIPVEPQFLVVIWPRLDVASCMRFTIDSADLASLIFRVDVIRVSRVLEHPESIAVEHVFPTMIGDAARVLRITYPRAVVLQSAIHLVRILLVHAHVIELRHRQVFAFPPFTAAVVPVPHPAVVSHEHYLRVRGIYPHVVRVSVCTLKTTNLGKAFSAVVAHNQSAIRLKQAVWIFGSTTRFAK